MVENFKSRTMHSGFNYSRNSPRGNENDTHRSSEVTYIISLEYVVKGSQNCHAKISPHLNNVLCHSHTRKIHMIAILHNFFSRNIHFSSHKHNNFAKMSPKGHFLLVIFM